VLKLHAATVTPLTDDGAAVDVRGIAELASALERSVVDGIFVCGTTGEGPLLSVAERQRATEAFRRHFPREVIAHCGAQSTSDTVALSEHAFSVGVDAVAVIAPPYYPLDVRSLVAHFAAAAEAAGDLPFYLYSFPARSGYPLPLSVVTELRRRVDSFIGIKASNATLDEVSALIETGVPVFVGAEPLVPPAVARGAVGAVSGLACVFPAVIDRLLRDPSAPVARLVDTIGDLFGTHAFCAAVKHALQLLGVAVNTNVRPPLRGLTASEQRAVATAIATVDRDFAALPRAAGDLARSEQC
jgi:dihydrodipicolinate synthase/N-acetylneuraminate lyase